VLEPNETCGNGALGVVVIPEGSTPNLPKTWPDLPMLIDSPGWDPVFKSETVEVRIPFSNMDAVKAASYDGVTAGLRVNQSVHAPLLCVVNVMYVASGDLSLPGKVSELGNFFRGTDAIPFCRKLLRTSYLGHGCPTPDKAI